MFAKRIIPCLDVAQGRVVKGTNFIDLKDAGDPVELAVYYDTQGADELVFLDITASQEERKTIVDVVRETAKKITIPLTVGGGISSVEDIRELLTAGAEKVSLNTAAVNNPELIAEAAEVFSKESVVVAIDAKAKAAGNGWEVFTRGGMTATGKDVIGWAREVEQLGAGEILLTSMDRDGTNSGYDLDLTARVSEAVSIPVIASGGAGNLQHLLEGITLGKADGVLAASIFHYKTYTIKEAKEYLKKNGVVVTV